jgi:thiol:disulfide interchange protein DsbD
MKQFFGVLLLAVAAYIVSPLFLSAKGDTKWVRVDTMAELDAKLAAPGKPVMLDFYADWCVSCKEMEAFTFSDAEVKKRLDGMLLLQVDVTANSAEHKALLKRFHLFGPPGIIFFDAQGREVKGLRVIGYQNAERFLKTLALLQAP